MALSPHLHGEPRGDAHKSLTTATRWSPEAGQTLMSGPAVTDQASRRTRRTRPRSGPLRNPIRVPLMLPG